jgi:3-oxoacyl-[acyl-carrier-protein] synthase-3
VAFLKCFGSYVPERVVSNDEAGALAGVNAEWIRNVSGIEERRYAADGESVVDMGVRAAQDCFHRNGRHQVGMLLVASGSFERRFPGPACMISQRLELGDIPAIDLPIASAGSLFGLSLADRLCQAAGDILVIGAEKMSAVVGLDPANRATAVLFGDGAGACVVSPDSGMARVLSSVIQSDGAFSEDLKLEFGKPLEMNGRSVILQASRKVPRAISQALAECGRDVADVGRFLMHQANQNLIVRVAAALGVPQDKFFSNIRAYGNTSSASMLIAASECFRQKSLAHGEIVVFTAFGAGYNWGALVAEAC